MSGDARRSVGGAEYVLLASVVFCAACALVLGDYIPDDSYISFRYAQNLAEGHGLRFNPTEPPVEGYSNFLWILLCALIHKLGFSLPDVIPYVGISLSMLSVLLLWGLFKRRGLPPRQMLIPLLLLAGSAPVVLYAVSGMETPLYAFLLLAMIYGLDLVLAEGKRRHYAVMTAAAVLLSLSRPEGMLALPIAAVAVPWLGKRSGRPSERVSGRGFAVSLAAFAACLVAYHVWRVGYFGEWLPTPLLSKGGAGISPATAWLMNLKFYFVKHMYYIPPMGFYYGALFVLAFIGAFFSSSAPMLRRTEIAALVIAVAYAAVYFNFKDWMPGMRYHAPYVALLLLPAVHVQEAFFAQTRPAVRQTAFRLAVAAVLAVNLGILAELRIVAGISEEGSQKCNVLLGKWLRKNVPADALLAVSDVGAIPYFSRLRTLDINPQSLTDLRIAKDGFSIDYVAERRPQVIVLPSRSFVAAKFYTEHFEMASDPRFDDWRLIGVSRADWFDDRCYWVYVVKDFPLLSDEQVESFPHGLGSIARTYR